MSCPDRLTLDLWLADVLPAAEAAGPADHLADCPTCEASIQASRGMDRALGAALALDAAELDCLEGLNLARRWRAAPPAVWWYWLVFLGALASFAIWSVAGPVTRPVLELVTRTGLGVVLARALIESLVRLGEAVFMLAVSPMLGYSLPLLALLGLILLAWPRPRRMVPTRA